MNTKAQGFWMVVGSGQPVYRHQNLITATAECERLARLHQGQEFTVVKSVLSMKIDSLCRTIYVDVQADGNEIPF